ncbi:sugar ABC transporter ATP-binding protein [Mesorhizobium sp. M7A.F.Ca.US.006.01.1.1]|uniref:sugar ABC transporter ATP-binding protein n=1 Tax=Mesorhizobium sp. M7A.F.Ca.US.006.01.1.1 TaxID=2496707 RepID=UPI000FCB9FBF|nr:sugar ABC transporter ATP-binding protein [Mesorhizobium sp. M7A.F.Ca.US.006.01.1.1]RUZ77857.1 sugar ABC transporter ATP-binding protein [Mesorhizobium sp. M7A.F.Ca.US.006.01.1.1]
MQLLKLQDVTKRFRGVTALSHVNFDLNEGEVHVLFGENGAGKSTLINLIAGTFALDEGRCFLKELELGRLSPAQSRDAGIGVVFQEFSLVPQMKVVENLFLGREHKSAWGRLDHKRMREEGQRALEDFGFNVKIDRRVGDLSRAEQQMIEITKALLFEPKILILDEPTASLTEAEASNLFRLIGELKAKGVGIIYVSHRMKEIRTLADRVTILRDGKLIATVPASTTSDEALVSLMTGRPLDRLFPEIPSNPGAVRLSVRGLSLAKGLVRGASLDVRAGEIVGLGGLLGSGQSDFVRAIFGLEDITAGTIFVDGDNKSRPTPGAMLDKKITYFPADRVAEGLALTRCVRENASISSLWLNRFSRRGLLRLGEERTAAKAVTSRLKLRPPNVENYVENLSGGNRQKVLLARGLMRDTDIFLFDEPTVGIDVNAKFEIYELMRDLVKSGSAIVMVSSDLQELLHLSHRLVIFNKGQIAADLTGPDITEDNALKHFFSEELPVSRSFDKEEAVYDSTFA